MPTRWALVPLHSPRSIRQVLRMIDSHDYALELVGTGPKTGGFSDGPEVPSLSVASPPEFGGPGGIWSPEHLFVAAISSCLMTTFRAIAAMSQLEVAEYSDTPSGRLVRDEGGLYRMESVTLRPRIVIDDPTKVDKARRILEKAERACLISRSVSATIGVEDTIVVAAPV